MYLKERYINSLIERYPRLDNVSKDIYDAYLVMEKCYINQGKLLIAGNGGSAADSEHMAAELMKSFRLKRAIDDELACCIKEIDVDRGALLERSLEKTLTAIPLVAHEAITTAYANDVSSVAGFAQQLLGYGQRGDVFLAISTSGNSENVIHAAIVAKALGIKVIGLTGAKGGNLEKYADIIVKVPELETYRIQELHLPIYHCWCMMLEERFFGQ